MARRLLKAGHEVTVWNRTAHHAEPLAAEGAAVAGSPAEAGAGAEFAITIVATPEALQTLVLGENGLAKGLAAGHVYIDMSTVGPDTVRSIAARLPVGVAVVDAPVRGSVSQPNPDAYGARQIKRSCRRLWGDGCSAAGATTRTEAGSPGS